MPLRKIIIVTSLLLTICTVTAQEGLNPFSAYPAGSKFIHKNLVALNGDTIMSATLDSSFVWYNFWHTRCKPCITEMGELNRIALEYKDNPKIMFIAIACDDSTNVAEFLKSHRFEFQTIAFCKTEFLSDFPVSHFPTNILVDSNQRVVIEIIGGVFNPEQVYDHIQPLTKRLEQMIMNQ